MLLLQLVFFFSFHSCICNQIFDFYIPNISLFYNVCAWSLIDPSSSICISGRTGHMYNFWSLFLAKINSIGIFYCQPDFILKYVQTFTFCQIFILMIVKHSTGIFIHIAWNAMSMINGCNLFFVLLKFRQIYYFIPQYYFFAWGFWVSIYVHVIPGILPSFTMFYLILMYRFCSRWCHPLLQMRHYVYHGLKG